VLLVYRVKSGKCLGIRRGCDLVSIIDSLRQIFFAENISILMGELIVRLHQLIYHATILYPSRAHEFIPRYCGGSVLLISLGFLCFPIMCHYVLSSVL
jgi:hypothetical protein